MKIAVIGAGAWGKNLVNNFSELGVLAAVADAVEGNRNWVAENHPEASLYEDADALFRSDGIDAVAIATPPHTHYTIAKKAMELGLDAFVEKPLTLDPVEAEDLIKVAKENDRILMVGHLLLYQPAISFVKNYLDDGNLGKIYTLHQRRSKLGRVRSVENVLWSFGVHDVAVLLYLAGEAPDKIQATGQCGLQKNVEDDTYLHLDFPNGVKAHLHNSWLWPKVERGLIIAGEKGILEYDEINQRVILHKKRIGSDLQNIDDGEEELFNGSGKPLLIELSHFIECCQSRKEPISGRSNGLDVVTVLMEANQLLNAARS